MSTKRFVSGRLPALAHAGAAGDPLLRVGAQSFSFRKFDVAGALAQLKTLGLTEMEFCAVHFPPDADDAGFDGVKQALAAAQVRVPCFGVEGFAGDAAANRRKFAFAKALGAGVLTADPAPEAFDQLETLCDEFGVKIAIHNHGPGARYDKAADTLGAVAGRSPLIGACLDTGHALRSGEQPHEVIEQLGDRLLSLHLKDWTVGGEEEILGEGDLDMGKVAAALRAVGFSGPIVMEYENSPDNPAPEMKQGLDAWRRVVQGG